MVIYNYLVKILLFFVLIYITKIVFIILWRKYLQNQMRKYGVESVIELKLYKALIRRKISVIPQYEIDGYRVDFAWITVDGVRIAIECDGKNYHSAIEDRIWDREKDIYLKQKGWKVMRFQGWKIMKNPNNCINILLKYKSGWSKVKEFRKVQSRFYQ